ncbi:MAG: methyltransferase domain-containing protein [Betaproteobacteria bacterium]
MSEELNSLLSEVERALSDGRLTDAAALLNVAQNEDATDARIYILGGQLGHRAGNPGAAVMALRRAVALSPGWVLAHTELGHALELAGRPAEALAAYRQAHALDTTNAAAAARISELSSHDVLSASEAEDSSSGNASVMRMRAAQLHASGELAEALSLLQSMIDARPADVETLSAVALIERERGDTEAAARWLTMALAIEPDNRMLRFQLAVLRGETPADTPPEVIARIFDAYAEGFDEHLVGGLNYHEHEAVVALLRARSPVPAPDILDLGCGTGLVGAALSPPFGRLVGVDLSSAMLDRARARDVYTELHHSELVTHLRTCPERSFDVVTAADVFVYIGELGPGLVQTARVLRPRGIAVLSLEAGADVGYQVLPSGRFAHHRAYLEKATLDAGLELADLAERQLRLQQGAPVAGYLVCLRRP